MSGCCIVFVSLSVMLPIRCSYYGMDDFNRWMAYLQFVLLYYEKVNDSGIFKVPSIKTTPRTAMTNHGSPTPAAADTP